MRPNGTDGKATLSCAAFLEQGNSSQGVAGGLPVIAGQADRLHQWWLATAGPSCCIYRGGGKACGDRVCATEGATVASSPGFLGDGVASRFPSVIPSNRPVLTNEAELSGYLAAAEAEPAFVPAGGWLQLCVRGLVNQACPTNGNDIKQHDINWLVALRTDSDPSWVLASVSAKLLTCLHSFLSATHNLLPSVLLSV